MTKQSCPVTIWASWLRFSAKAFLISCLSLFWVVTPLFAQSKRVITLGGSTTEIAFALGAGHRIVAVDSSSLYPKEAQDLPQIGYVAGINAEGLLAEGPDLILASSRAGPPAAVEILKSSSVPMVMLPSPNTAESLKKTVLQIGKALELETEAEALWLKIDADLQIVEKMKKEHAPKRAVFLIGRSGTAQAAGDGTLGAGIVKLAGGTNVFSGFSGYKQVTQEALAAEAPDFILIGTHGMASETPKETALERVGLGQIGSFTDAQVKILDMGKFLTFGPRTGAAALELAEIFASSE